MKEQRVQFLKLILEKMEADQDFTRGICYYINLLTFNGCSYVDFEQFMNWFQTQRPHARFHSKFYKHHTFINGGWWWLKSLDGKEQRMLFIQHLIEKQSLTKL